jgi:hypothetical protein
MKQFNKPCGAALALILGLGVGIDAACAQDASPAPAGPASSPSTDAAREALQKKEGDVDQTKLLKETLTATDKQYSLIKAGKTAATYDLTYSYTGQQQINVDFEKNTLTGISTTRAHTITNTLSVDHGLLDNLTGNVTVPLVSKYAQSDTFSGATTAFGDIALGARFQPFALRRDGPSLTATSTLRLPTGRSPFKTIIGQGLGTGAGYASVTAGVNASQVIDPVALFGSLNLTLGLPAKHLSQENNGKTLIELHPGPSLGFGAGFAYALSYNISTIYTFQETLSARSRLSVRNDTTGEIDSNVKTNMQSAATMNFGLGVRVSPLTTVNFSVGIGLTSDTPDFTFGMNMPLNF